MGQRLDPISVSQHYSSTRDVNELNNVGMSPYFYDFHYRLDQEQASRSSLYDSYDRPFASGQATGACMSSELPHYDLNLYERRDDDGRYRAL